MCVVLHWLVELGMCMCMCMCINRSIIEKTTPLFLIFSVFAWEVDWSGVLGSGWV